ncbi:hypothetical protein EC01304_2502, partial [Escherichia coli 0.1304]
MSASRG